MATVPPHFGRELHPHAEDGAQAFEQSRLIFPGFPFWVSHGLIAWMGWFVIGWLMFAANRYLVVYWRQAQIIHTVTALIVWAFTILVSAAAIKKKDGRVGNSLHNQLGVAALVLTSLICVQGILALSVRICCKWNQDIIRRTRFVHKILGIITFVFCLITTCIGFFAWRRKQVEGKFEDKNISIIGAGVFANGTLLLSIIFFIWFEIKHYYYRYGVECALEIKNPEFADKVMTEEEFKKRVTSGEKLVILDDLVLNVEGFSNYHPGGAFVIDHNIGRDVSKFFWGGYALTGNTPDPSATVSRIAHSNVAIKIANDLAIARLNRSSTPRLLATLDHSKTNKINKHTSTFFFKVQPGQSVEMAETQADGKEIDSENPMSCIQAYYADLGTIGKHFLVGSSIEGLEADSEKFREFAMTNKIRRHYTINSSMAPDFLGELMKICQQAIDSQPVEFNSEVLVGTPGTFPLSIKGYPVGGLSQQFHKERAQTFEVQGPLGKGLGLDTTTSGMHLAFAAGTGMLVFCDLVARLVLSTLQVIPKEQRLSSDFQLHLFASFASREEAIALEFLEKVEEMYQMTTNNQFKLTVRLSKEKQNPRRWDHGFIEDTLKENAGAKAVWVCGTPLIQEGFDKSLSEIAEQHSLDFKTQVDIM